MKLAHIGALLMKWRRGTLIASLCYFSFVFMHVSMNYKCGSLSESDYFMSISATSGIGSCKLKS